MFSTVLVANRGEIALRIMRACRELGLRTVAVYSEADRDALHVQYADDAYRVGPPQPTESYLNIPAVVDAARKARAGAIHPGYGFLAENPRFAQAVGDAGLTFIGPTPEAMRRLGGKLEARREAEAAGVPLVLGSMAPVATPDDARRLAQEYGYPVAIKASAGGGGRGLRVAATAADVDDAFAAARREAAAYFASEELYVERYLPNPRHIEIQILADTHGTVLHLGERDCSVQRRHQKLIEEAPSPVLDAAQRAAIGAAAVRLARQVGYTGVGTLEFLWQDGQFFFLEMNTRIQVEHPVTEEVTGVDLVKWQIAVAQGVRLPWTQEQIQLRGHAIECRINAESPADNFRPSSGTLETYHEPHGMGVRVEAGYREGMALPPHYDSLLAKLIVRGQDREEAIARMRRALDDWEIAGIQTTIPFHRWAMAHPLFVRGEATVRFVEQHFTPEALGPLPASSPAPAREAPPLQGARTFEVEVNGRRFEVRVGERGAGDNGAARPARGGRPLPRRSERSDGDPDAVKTPITGAVLAVNVAPGAVVAAGQVLAVVEAMKMENEILAPRAGTVAEVRTAPGVTVQANETLVTLAP